MSTTINRSSSADSALLASVSSLPLENATDADTDIAVLREIPHQFCIEDEKSAAWLVRKVMASRQYAERVRQWADQELARAAREEKTLLFLFGRQLEAWAKSEIDKFKGKRKSLNLPPGCVGFRSTPTRIVVDDEARVLEWARHNLPVAVITVEKLSKSVLNEHCEKTGELPDDGIHVEPAAEKFFIR